MSAKQQSKRLTKQQKAAEGALGIFGEKAKQHDVEIAKTALRAMELLQKEFPNLTFRHRKHVYKKEINKKLQKIDKDLGKTLFVKDALVKPDGGIIEVKDDFNKWRVILISEAKHQGNDIENIEAGKLVGKNNDQDLMVAGNAIERAHKNISEFANFMMDEFYFPYVLFLEGSNFLTHDLVITRPDGRKVTLTYNSGALNRLDRLTSANYGMNINENLCRNKIISNNGFTFMLQATSIYTQIDGGRWQEKDVLKIMLDVATTSLQMLARDIFKQLTHSVASEENL